MEITKGNLSIVYRGVVYPIGCIKDMSQNQWGEITENDEIPYLELFFAIDQLTGLFGIDGSASVQTLFSLDVFQEVPMNDSFELFSSPSSDEYQVIIDAPDQVIFWPKIINHISTICVTSQIVTLNILTSSYQSMASQRYILTDIEKEVSDA